MVRVGGLRSAENGIWNINAIHGKRHAPISCKSVPQTMSPSPLAPHPTKHCWCESWNGGGGMLGCVAFQVLTCSSLDLSPHAVVSASPPTKLTRSLMIDHPMEFHVKQTRKQRGKVAAKVALSRLTMAWESGGTSGSRSAATFPVPLELREANPCGDYI